MLLFDESIQSVTELVQYSVENFCWLEMSEVNLIFTGTVI